MPQFSPYQLIKNVLNQQLTGDQQQIMELKKILTENFISSTEKEQIELFSSPTLDLIFEQLNKCPNEIVLHMLGLMMLFNQQFSRIKYYIDETQDQFNKFFGSLKYLDNQEIFDFYIDILKQIKFDKEETCNSLTNLITQKIQQFSDVSVAQQFCELIGVMITNLNPMLDLQLMQEFQKLLKVDTMNQSKTDNSVDNSEFALTPTKPDIISVIGLSCCIPKLFQISYRILNNPDDSANNKIEVTKNTDSMNKKSELGRSSLEKTKPGADLLKHCLSDEEDACNDKASPIHNFVTEKPEYMDFLKPQIDIDYKNIRMKLKPQPIIPKQTGLSVGLPKLNEEDETAKVNQQQNYADIDVRSQASSIFQMREQSVVIIDSNSQAIALSFEDSLYQFINNQIENLQNNDSVINEYISNFIYQIAHVCFQDGNQDFFSKITKNIEKYLDYCIQHNKNGIMLMYLMQIQQYEIRLQQIMPLSSEQIKVFKVLTDNIINDNSILCNFARQLYQNKDDFLKYAKNNGFIPQKVRTQLIAYFCNLYKEFYIVTNKAKDIEYKQSQDSVLDYYILPQEECVALFDVAQSIINKKQYRPIHQQQVLDQQKKLLDESVIQDKYQKILELVPTIQNEKFKYVMVQRRVDQVIKSIAPKATSNIFTFNISLNKNTNEESSSEDDTFGKMLETKRLQTILENQVKSKFLTKQDTPQENSGQLRENNDDIKNNLNNYEQDEIIDEGESLQENKLVSSNSKINIQGNKVNILQLNLSNENSEEQ